MIPESDKRPVLAGGLGVKKKSFNKQRHNITASSQRARILDWFLNVSSRLSTINAREKLGIMSPAPRILELRRMGHTIYSERQRLEDSSGTFHRSGVYVYQGVTHE